MTQKTILEIKNLNISFSQKDRKIEAVKNLSLDVQENSFTCLVGESGSGKTVTALSLTRLVPSASVTGNIFWEFGGHITKLFSKVETLENNLVMCPQNTDLTKLSEKELSQFRGRQISYVFQDPATSLNPLIRVGDQINETYLAHFPTTYEEAKKETLAHLESVQLKDVERVYRAYPHELSGGMKQRAMIAMALVAKPKLLVADEPTTALDVTVEREILKLLEELRKSRNLTILFITHNLRLAASYADVIYVMKKGEVAEKVERGARGFSMQSDYGKQLFRAGLMGVGPKTFIEV